MTSLERFPEIAATTAASTSGWSAGADIGYTNWKLL